MALRIKSHWHDEEAQRSLDEIAGAIAYICWRQSKEKAIALHGEDFVYANDDQRMRVMLEYAIFQLQIADRLARQRFELDDETREKLIIAAARGVAAQVQNNSEDLFGPGDYVPPFIALLNECGAEYSEMSYNDDGPSYPFMRHLGYRIQQVMGNEGENRWVIDQVMDKDGPEVAKQIARAMDNLFG